MPGFLAYIIPVDTGARPDNTLPGGQPYPDQGLPGLPPGIWGPTDPRPTHPIAPGGAPPGIWGGGNQPFPTPPIYIPPEGSPPPLGIWGPTDPRPGTGLPGAQPGPDQGLPPHPAHPIVLPPNLPPTIPGEGDGPDRPIDWKTAWTPQTGWVVVGIPAEGVPVPTPSEGGGRRR